MAVSILDPKFYAWDNDTGKPLAFGKVYTYQAGTNTPKATFTSETGATENANPVILNGAGYADIYLDGSYKVVVKDADDVKVWTADPVTDPSGLQREWINERTATQVSPTSFSMVGNYTDLYTPGKALQLDDTTYLYGHVDSVQYLNGNTVVEVASAYPLTADLTRAWTGIISDKSIPQGTDKAIADRVIRVGSVAEIESYDVPAGYVFSLNDGTHSRIIDVVSGDFSAELAADINNGLYVPVGGDPDGLNKVGKTRIQGGTVYLRWFNPDTTGATEVQAVIQSAVNLTPDYYTLDYAGLAGTMLIDVPAGQTIQRPRGIYINHPITLKGTLGCVTKIKDFCSAWMDYTGDITAYQAEYSDVKITGVTVDANADNHYEVDTNGNKWWETGPESKSPPSGIGAYCPEGADNLTGIIVEDNVIHRPLQGVQANGSLGGTSGFAFDDPTFLDGTLKTSLVDGAIFRNNTIHRARGNNVLFNRGVINSEMYGNQSYNSMYHIARFYLSVMNCHAYSNYAFVDYEYLKTGYNQTDLWYWRTDLAESGNYKIKRSGYRIGSGFTAVLNCSMRENVISYNSRLAVSIIDTDSANAASFTMTISAIKNNSFTDNASYNSPFGGIFAIAQNNLGEEINTEGCIFSGNKIIRCQKRSVFIQGNAFTVKDNYFEDCTEVGGTSIVRIKGQKVSYYKNVHKFNVNGAQTINTVFDIFSTVADGQDRLFISDNYLEGHAGTLYTLADPAVMTHGSNIGIRPQLESGWVLRNNTDFVLYINCAGEVTVRGMLDGTNKTSDIIYTLPKAYIPENINHYGIGIQASPSGDGIPAGASVPIRLAGVFKVIDIGGGTLNLLSIPLSYKAMMLDIFE